MRLTVRVTPRGGRDAFDGWMRDAAGQALLKLRVRAAPSDGEANAAVEALVAKLLDRPKSAVKVTGGHKARIKQLTIEGVLAADLERVFGPQPPDQVASR